MKNQWKKKSKLSPQKEDGHRRISTEVFLEILKAELKGAEIKVVLAIIHKTWGFQKQFDAISISQLTELTNLSKRMIKYALKSLIDKRIICCETSDKRVQRGSPLNNYLFNKHYDTWQGCNVVHPFKGAIDGKQGVQPLHPQKKLYNINTTKEKSIKKKRKKPSVGIPKNYQLEQKHIDYAIKNKIEKNDIEYIFEGFCIHHRKKGSEWVDWYAAWQTWVRNNIKFEKENGQPQQPVLETEESINARRNS